MRLDSSVTFHRTTGRAFSRVVSDSCSDLQYKDKDVVQCCMLHYHVDGDTDSPSPWKSCIRSRMRTYCTVCIPRLLLPTSSFTFTSTSALVVCFVDYCCCYIIANGSKPSIAHSHLLSKWRSIASMEHHHCNLPYTLLGCTRRNHDEEDAFTSIQYSGWMTTLSSHVPWLFHHCCERWGYKKTRVAWAIVYKDSRYQDWVYLFVSLPLLSQQTILLFFFPPKPNNPSSLSITTTVFGLVSTPLRERYPSVAVSVSRIPTINPASRPKAPKSSRNLTKSLLVPGRTCIINTRIVLSSE